MKTSIFLRTYRRDIAWLNYSLQSIAKYCKGFHEVVICIPESQRSLLNHLTTEKIVTCPDYDNDYLGQQCSKILSYKHCTGENIMFTDSDCIFFRTTSPEDFMKEGKPWILKTPYLKVGDAICWKAPTEMALHSAISHEYMRRLPLLYKSSTLKAIDNYLGGAEKYILSKDSFSEFNLIGAYAELYEKKDYVFYDTDFCNLPPVHLKQFFSHDGVENHLIEIEEYLK